jgi:hypothetical protein
MSAAYWADKVKWWHLSKNKQNAYKISI